MNALNSRQFLLPKGASRHVANSEIVKSLRTQQRHVHGTHQCDEGFVGAYVRGCSMPSNVLFPGRKREAVGFLTINIDASTNDSARHQSQVGLAASKNPVNWAATSDRTSKRLAFTNHNICSVSTWRLHQSEGNWLNCYDEGGVLTDNLLQQRKSTIENTDRVWLLNIDTTGTCCFLCRGEIDGAVWIVSEQFNVNLRTLAVILHDRHTVWRR